MSSRRELSSAVSSASSSLNWSLCGGIPNTFPVGHPLPVLERIFAVPPTVAGLDLTGGTSLCAGDLREEGCVVGSSSKELTISTTDRVFSLQRKTSIQKNNFNVVQSSNLQLKLLKFPGVVNSYHRFWLLQLLPRNYWYFIILQCILMFYFSISIIQYN